MRPITNGCTARRAWSTLLRDSRLADLSAESALGIGSAGHAVVRDSAAVSPDAVGCARRSERSGVGTAKIAAAGTMASGSAMSATVGELKLVAGRTGLNTSDT